MAGKGGEFLERGVCGAHSHESHQRSRMRTRALTFDKIEKKPSSVRQCNQLRFKDQTALNNNNNTLLHLPLYVDKSFLLVQSFSKNILNTCEGRKLYIKKEIKLIYIYKKIKLVSV